MNVRVVMMGAWLPYVAWAQSSFTDARDHRPTDTFAINACSDAATREVRARNPMAGQVESLDATTSSASDARTDVSGKGRFADPAGAMRSFSYRCSYDLRTSTTSAVSVSFAE